jgi:uncharacterized protein (TIGR00369 family)
MTKRRELPRYEGCFVCGDPSINPRSLELRSYAEEGMVKALFRPQREHAGYPGMVHGGILVSVLDEISIWAASLAAESFCVTREFRTKFRKPARPGEELSLEAQVTKQHGRLLTVEAKATNLKGEEVACSVGRFFPAFPEEWQKRVKQSLR